MAMTIARAVKGLLIKESFYGLFLLGLNKQFDNSIPTACVHLKGINLEILVNEEYWNSLPDEHKICLLQHEVSHILFKHMLAMQDYSDSTRFNIASDLHVNSYISGCPQEWLLPSQFEMPYARGTKWYYENLPEGIENAYKPLDTHDWKGFEKLSEAEKRLINNQIDYQVKAVAEQVMKTCGSIPGQFSEYVNGLFKQKEAVFNWKAYFRRVIGNSIKTYIKSTRYKPSFRFKGQPGTCLKFKPKIMVAIDTSGSVSTTELSDFFSEVQHLYNSGVVVEIVEFDTCVQKRFIYKGLKTDIEIKGRGGTDMTEVYNLYIAHPEFSTLVVFTDGYLDINFPKHRNMIWVISSEGQQQEYPGIAVYIPKQK